MKEAEAFFAKGTANAKAWRPDHLGRLLRILGPRCGIKGVLNGAVGREGADAKRAGPASSPKAQLMGSCRATLLASVFLG